MQKSVIIISTLDTKGEETFYLKDKIESMGVKPIIMDLSMGRAVESPAEITLFKKYFAWFRGLSGKAVK